MFQNTLSPHKIPSQLTFLFKPNAKVSCEGILLGDKVF